MKSCVIGRSFSAFKTKTIMREWVFTTKPEHFRMEEALVPGETLDWPSFSHFKFQPGDLVFFYASSPVAQMIGKLEIERTDLDFATEVNPRNDLRKWPKQHSRIPWLRLRVLQCAPVPFKPLQRGSLYYHTDFKPSPYPKLLHEGEREYVMRAFEEAAEYRREMAGCERGIEEAAFKKVIAGENPRLMLENLTGGTVESLDYSREDRRITVSVSTVDKVVTSLEFNGVIRAMWDCEMSENSVTGVRLRTEGIYLLCSLDGIGLELLSESLKID